MCLHYFFILRFGWLEITRICPPPDLREIQDWAGSVPSAPTREGRARRMVCAVAVLDVARIVRRDPTSVDGAVPVVNGARGETGLPPNGNSRSITPRVFGYTPPLSHSDTFPDEFAAESFFHRAVGPRRATRGPAACRLLVTLASRDPFLPRLAGSIVTHHVTIKRRLGGSAESGREVVGNPQRSSLCAGGLW